MSNKNLHKSKIEKNDEFYTQFADINKEIKYYKNFLQNKIIYCNCDNYKESNFWKYFYQNFDNLKLKKLIATYYNIKEPAHKIEYDGKNKMITTLKGNGDFRSQECIDILKSSDIVVTNPPFSLFREFVDYLIDYKKQFLIIRNKNAINYNNVLNCICKNELRFGYTIPEKFITPKGITKKLRGLCRWFTNLKIEKSYQKLNLTKRYNPIDYSTYDNYNAINVNKVSDIPYDYNGIMGVPITYIDKHNPEQFKILGRSGNISWAINDCTFFTPPSKEKQYIYKSYDKNWRVQNSYLLNEEGLPISIYYRLFIRKI